MPVFSLLTIVPFIIAAVSAYVFIVAAVLARSMPRFAVFSLCLCISVFAAIYFAAASLKGSSWALNFMLSGLGWGAALFAVYVITALTVLSCMEHRARRITRADHPV